ncbi:gamma-glutamylcyclotransferase [Mangrovimicrobium sediminis]|uniref:Gamma-glutamylcyclotransferase n=1 Tax=Mangrovimicrobium sediminis TaxID=2562682 RepID=A0A4Z0M496_9GAMM|nr:gamma-glutamylcyclotransferase family protein [Haliea sp. SAOS-164]TGD74339.1 gamma-glutamylcyclotransferase [Haliea sp. SAOS-164]
MTEGRLLYFAYGSNMSLARLCARVPGALPLGQRRLSGYTLRFHKRGTDGSAKCDAFFTGSENDAVLGMLYAVHLSGKAVLDEIEGLERGYDEKQVELSCSRGTRCAASTYVATAIDPTLLPFDWYLQHVLAGARDAALPADYVRRAIESVAVVSDPDVQRGALEFAVHRR